MAGRGIGTGDSAQAVTDFVHGLQKYHRILPHFQWMTAQMRPDPCSSRTTLVTAPEKGQFSRNKTE
jgi:hypothetical protein